MDRDDRQRVLSLRQLSRESGPALHRHGRCGAGGQRSRARSFKAEKNHGYYIQAQEDGWSVLSLYAIEDKNGCSGEEVVRDETQDVEAEAIRRMETAALRQALEYLDSESRQMIHALYLADTRKTLRQLSLENGVPVMTLQDRKKKVLALLGRNMSRKNF